jgi:hypothetical protein
VRRALPIATTLSLASLFALCLPGCAGRKKDPALVAYQGFIAAVRGGRAARVWTALTPESRARLAKSLDIPATADGAAAAKVLGVRPGWQFEFDLPQKARLDKEASTPERRVVRGPLAGRQWRIVMRQIDGAWRVDLDASRPDDPQPG